MMRGKERVEESSNGKKIKIYTIRNFFKNKEKNHNWSYNNKFISTIHVAPKLVIIIKYKATMTNIIL